MHTLLETTLVLSLLVTHKPSFSFKPPILLNMHMALEIVLILSINYMLSKKEHDVMRIEQYIPMTCPKSEM